MSNRAELQRLRTTKSISSNPFIIQNAKVIGSDINRYNAEREAITDTDFPGPIVVSIIKRDNVIPQPTGEATPRIIEDSYYLIAEYTTEVPKGLRFTYINNKRFETLEPEKVIDAGLHVYTRVDLKELNNV